MRNEYSPAHDDLTPCRRCLANLGWAVAWVAGVLLSVLFVSFSLVAPDFVRACVDAVVGCLVIDSATD